MATPHWLIARPIAHRGLHNRKVGVIENTLGAANAAVALRFAIECDVQSTSDGEVVVFHDEFLDRLTKTEGAVKEHTLSDLQRLTLKDSDEKIPSLIEFLDEIAGIVPLICEIKSNFDDNPKTTLRTLEILKTYPGPVAIKSFDPFIVALTRDLAPERPRGFIGESTYGDPEWNFLGERKKEYLIGLTHLAENNTDFISWYKNDISQTGPRLAREFSGLPLMTWTVHTSDEMDYCRPFSDQIVFESFLP
jgi:glycerophosphoryl diester phosphodiesterase